MRRKSTSTYGQSLKSRADDSKGGRKKELNKLSKVDKENYAKAPKAVQARIKRDYSKASDARVKKRGKYI